LGGFAFRSFGLPAIVLLGSSGMLVLPPWSYMQPSHSNMRQKQDPAVLHDKSYPVKLLCLSNQPLGNKYRIYFEAYHVNVHITSIQAEASARIRCPLMAEGIPPIRKVVLKVEYHE